jgi:N-glycosylase/DNA lyase
MTQVLRQTFWPVRDYDLAATLGCGQAFRWEPRGDAWEGVVGGRWARLWARPEGILAEALFPEEIRKINRTCHELPGGASRASSRDRARASCNSALRGVEEGGAPEWEWLAGYLQTGVDLGEVLATFPDDGPMRAAVARCRGLRLLRQEPWECLASFILSSTKQIVQIRQIIGRLCQGFGEPVPVPEGHAPAFAFPTAERVARCGEAALRDCRMGFRAPYLLGAARRVAEKAVRLDRLGGWSLEQARNELLTLPGVGRKIADCVLLFSCGFAGAFPVDVWIMKALRQLYFSKRRPAPRRLRAFADTHFGPNGGLAQQYLFHYMRLTARSVSQPAAPSSSSFP